jgi:hypothetical protein
MNSRNTPNWRDEDKRLQSEFADISALHQRSAAKSPAVPHDLDKSVLHQARLHHTEAITSSWILSPAMLLALGTLLLFVIGILYAVSLDHPAVQQTAPTPIPRLSMSNHYEQSMCWSCHAVFAAAQPCRSASESV